jgi:hypothetical protein
MPDTFDICILDCYEHIAPHEPRLYIPLRILDYSLNLIDHVRE